MTDRAGQRLGNYLLTRRLGEGGFAEVYLGEHIHLGTQAAIKVLHTQLTSEDVEKFRTEARAIARLLHPNIVRVLDFGMDANTPYLVMDYAPHGTLRQRHSRGIPLAVTTVVSYVKQLADALQHAHEEKLIHRDIKPENMLLGRRDEILLSDFGIAIVAQSSRYQGTQDMAGTIAYMAPEQIQAHPRPASDQYSLGVVVYEWLSGDRPFHGTFTEIAIKHTIVSPPSLRENVPALSPDVEHVVMMALAKDPKERFASVQAFATAFEQACQSEQPTYVSLKPRPPLPSSLPPTQHAVPLPHPETAPVARPSPAPLPPVKESPRTPTPPGRISSPMGTLLYTFQGHSGWVWAVAWSPDGQRIASADIGLVQVWPPQSDSVAAGVNSVIHRGHTASVNGVTWSPDGQRLASGSDDKTVQVWDAATGHSVLTYRGHPNVVNTVAWSPDGQRLASGSTDGVRVWDAATGRSILIYRGHSGWVWAVAWSPDGRYIASGSSDRTVQVWDAITGSKRLAYNGHNAIVHAVAWSPDGGYIASAGRDKTVQVWQAV